MSGSRWLYNMMFPSDMSQNLDELATSIERFFPKEPERAFEEFVGWGKGNIVASIAFNIAWEYLSLRHARENPLHATRPIQPTDITPPSMN
tara:strand:+ start:1012 stop:1284 length:273 start_codon:yes stop_codon:yes gene_type:complete